MSVTREAIFSALETALDLISATTWTLTDSQALTIPSSSPYTITPTPPKSGTWASTVSVAFTATGVALSATGGTPTTGQYKAVAGLYTFAAADAGKGVTIAFTYTSTILPGGCTRKLPSIEGISDYSFPMIGLVELQEERTQDKGSPALIEMGATAVVYLEPGEATATIKSTQLNAILDAIDLAMKPDPVSGVLTLGGLCTHCWIEGTTEIAEDLTVGLAQAAVPIKILWGYDNDGSSRRFLFDSGAIYCTPQTDQGSNAALSNQQSVKLAALKGVTLDLEETTTMIRTGLSYPVGAGTKHRDITGKARFATFDATMASKLFWSASSASGATLASVDQSGTIPSSAVYTITPVVPNSGTWASDLGVVWSTSGAALTLTTGTPSTGQYSVTTGVYTFAAADKGLGVNISYTYTTASGTKMDIGNPVGGRLGTFRVVLNGGYNGKQMTMVLPSCALTKLSIPMELEKFTVQNLEFNVMADANGIGTISVL